MRWGKGIDAEGAPGGDNTWTKISGSFRFISSAITLSLLTACMNGRKEPFLQNLGGLLCNSDKPDVAFAFGDWMENPGPGLWMPSVKPSLDQGLCGWGGSAGFAMLDLVASQKAY